jgi:hypothetical protein
MPRTATITSRSSTSLAVTCFPVGVCSLVRRQLLTRVYGFRGGASLCFSLLSLRFPKISVLLPRQLLQAADRRLTLISKLQGFWRSPSPRIPLRLWPSLPHRLCRCQPLRRRQWPDASVTQGIWPLTSAIIVPSASLIYYSRTSPTNLSSSAIHRHQDWRSYASARKATTSSAGWTLGTSEMGRHRHTVITGVGNGRAQCGH